MRSGKTLIFIAFALSFGLGTAAARDGSIPNAIWLWSETSHAVSNSTAALATGHTDRAIRLALRAVATETGPERVIAVHNLCLAWLANSEPEAAKGYCDETIVAIAGESGLATEQQAAALENIKRARRDYGGNRPVQLAERDVCD